jgi:hypothetical protein
MSSMTALSPSALRLRSLRGACGWLSGQLVAEAPAEQRLDPDLEAAILESYEITERYAS